MTKDIQAESAGTNFIDVGIHENVELVKIETGVSEKKNEFLAFYFKDSKGKELSHTEWKPVDQDAERTKSKITNQLRRVKHIATKFVTEDEFIFEAENFKQFSEKVVSILKDKFQGKKVRIKAVYSYNNYVSLPNYLPFIESMSIPKIKSKLEISSIDKMTRERADTEIPVVNPFEDTTIKTEAKTGSDLPF
jgi:hypothetical protein